MGRSDSPLLDAVRAVQAGRSSVDELLAGYLDRLRETDGPVNAWVHVAPVRPQVPAGDSRDLFGACVGLKDTIHVAGCPSTGSSPALRGFVPKGSSTVWRRLRAAGAVLIGKQECHELGSGVTTPQTANPWNLERSAGGSSGGSAAAVAAGSAPASIGTDAGGSVRIPAALCGLTGIRPSIGRVSRHGIIQRSPSLGAVGPIARSVADCSVLLQTLAGPDPKDPRTIELGRPPRYPIRAGEINDLRLGVPVDLWQAADESVVLPCEDALSVLEQLGVRLQPIEAPTGTSDVAGQLVPLLLAEFATTMRSSPWPVERMGWHVRHQIERGNAVGDVQLDELKAQRRRYAADWRRQFEDAGLAGAVFPTVPITAPYRDLGGTGHGAAARLRQFASIASWADLPEVTFPVGWSAGLPVGLSVLGASRSEVVVLRAGLAYQGVTDFHEARPGLNRM